MADDSFFTNALLTLYLSAPLTFLSLQYLQAPYGKHFRTGWGPTLHPAVAWILMESPTLWLTLLLFPCGKNRSNPISLTLISFFIFHYFHRTCIYPLRLKTPRRKIATSFPLSVALMAFIFNLLNSYLQARWISHYGDYSRTGWWFWVGLAVFLGGMAVNIRSDLILTSLKGEDGGYKMPRGGLFEVVSCPNYFGEVVEWFGWALMTWSLVGFGFFVYTCANLVPRARAHRRWYWEKYPEEYPKSRKAIIPFVY